MNKETFENDLPNILTSFYTNKNTRKTYEGYLSRFKRIDESKNLLDIIRDEDIFINQILKENERSLTQQNVILGFLYGFIKNIKKFYPDLYASIFNDEYVNLIGKYKKTVNLKYDKHRKSNLCRANITEQNLTMQLLYDKYDDMIKDGMQNDPVFLILSCIVLMPPRRLDWLYCKFVNEMPIEVDTNFNYIVINDNKPIQLNFFNYKKAKWINENNKNWSRNLVNSEFEYFTKVSQFTKINPEEFAKVLKHSYERKPRTYLFEDKKGNIFEPNHFSKHSTALLKKLLKKNITMTNSRTMFITHLYKNNINTYFKEEIGKDMDHKLTTALQYQHIPDNISESDKELFLELQKEEKIELELENNSANISNELDYMENMDISQKEVKDTQNIDENTHIQEVNNTPVINNENTHISKEDILMALAKHNPDYLLKLIR